MQTLFVAFVHGSVERSKKKKTVKQRTLRCFKKTRLLEQVVHKEPVKDLISSKHAFAWHVCGLAYGRRVTFIFKRNFSTGLDGLYTKSRQLLNFHHHLHEN